MLSIDEEYQNAIKTGNRQYADYLSRIMKGLNNDPGAQASVGMGASSAVPPLPPLKSIQEYSEAFLSGMPGGILAAGASKYSGAVVDKTVNAVTGGFWDFANNITRVATVIIGAAFIAAGLFGLAGGKAIHIYQSIKP